MKLSSPDFKNNGSIPTRYSGEGDNTAPPLEWTDVPSSCKELAIICEDPDAPKRVGVDHPFAHWVYYGIPDTTTSTYDGKIDAVQGKNSFGKLGYGGPMPPVGHGIHHYHFKLYALDSALKLPPGLTKNELMNAMQGHILAEAKLTGTYARDLPHTAVPA